MDDDSIKTDGTHKTHNKSPLNTFKAPHCTLSLGTL